MAALQTAPRSLPNGDGGAENIRHAPSEYLRRVWLYAWQFAGPDKLLYASDHPWVDPQLIIDQIEGQKLPAADLAKLYSGNASDLFQL
jgi:predicted TIM-barrel fold metal-dependent hydrolase